MHFQFSTVKVRGRVTPSKVNCPSICAGAVSGFLREDGSGALFQAFLFAAIFLLAGTPCMMLWLGFGAAMQRVLKSERALRGFNIAMGVLLALTVLLLL